MIRIGVSGSSGFIGGVVFSRLADNDRFVTERINRGGDEYYFEGHFDVIVHCGEVSDRNIVNSLGINYLNTATKNVEHLISKCTYLLYLSSSALYDSGFNAPKSENSDLSIIDNYTSTKYSVENIVLGAGGAVLRVANVFGRGMSESNVISDIFAQSGREIITLKNVHSVRDFIHVADLAEYILELVDIRYRGVINVGSGEGWSIRQIAEFVDQIGGDGKAEICSVLKPNTNSIVLDVTKLQGMCRHRNIHDMRRFLISEMKFRNIEC